MSTVRPLTNMCNLPPWEIVSQAYNKNPKPLSIQGIRTTHHQFFAKLDRLDTWSDRARSYEDYMEVAFHLHQWRQERDPSGHLSLKNSYLRFLRGWLYDSNSAEGAVMKGWVESRLGIAPTFHREPIQDRKSKGYMDYMQARLNAAARTSAIFSQLDLLYEFVQYELSRRDPNQTHLTLYRGVYDFAEQTIIQQADNSHATLQLNNLNSFTHDFERAWEFGTIVIEVQVPTPKIFFDGTFLHDGILKGEEEVLVIGGKYDVTLRRY